MAAFLTFALVFAHWQGLAHRIAHASQLYASTSTAAGHKAASAHHKAVQHSCLAFDAATVAPAIASWPCSPTVLPGNHVLALWAAFDSWDAPFTPHFSSRAPPLA
jgi:hypothetical protein